MVMVTKWTDSTTSQHGGGGRPVGLAAMPRIIVQHALVHVSDERLLSGGSASWSSLDLALVDGAEARLPSS